MEEIIRSIILGIIQGLTEFLPVSSSGHLELFKYFLGDTSVAEESMLMTVTLHAATALSTLVVFHKDAMEIFRGLFRFRWNEQYIFSMKILLSMIPAAAIGLLLETQIEQLFSRQILMVGCMLLITGVILFLADRVQNTDKAVSYKNAFFVGIAQAVAILPGISRSGATISTSVLLGIDREKAARFSFLMVVPLILGKMAKDILMGKPEHFSNQWVALVCGFMAAFVTGYLACTWMISLVKNSKLTYFSVYCFVVAALAIGICIFC